MNQESLIKEYDISHRSSYVAQNEVHYNHSLSSNYALTPFWRQKVEPKAAERSNLRFFGARPALPHNEKSAVHTIFRIPTSQSLISIALSELENKGHHLYEGYIKINLARSIIVKERKAIKKQ